MVKGIMSASISGICHSISAETAANASLSAAIDSVRMKATGNTLPSDKNHQEKDNPNGDDSVREVFFSLIHAGNCANAGQSRLPAGELKRRR
jgi:hypothetical protein